MESTRHSCHILKKLEFFDRFWKKAEKKIVFCIQHLSETFLILKIIQRGTTINFNKSTWKVPVILAIF